MSKREVNNSCFYVDGFGILRSEKFIKNPRPNLTYLVITIGEMKCLAYGRGVADFQKCLPGEMVYIQGELRTDKQGYVIFISRYKYLGDIFGELIDCGPMPEIEGYATNERVIIALKDRLPGGPYYTDTIRVEDLARD